MRLADPHLHVGQLVRIRPHDGNPHFGRGWLVGLEGRFALVKPLQRHRQIEKVPLADLHSWAAGNATVGVAMNQQPTQQQSPTDGPWVVADVENVRFFVSTWAGFQPELNRAKVYDKLRSANHSAAFARKRPASEVGRVEVLTTRQAEQLVQNRIYLGPEEPQLAEASGSERPAMAFDLSLASPDDLRLAAGTLQRLADAEAMYREAEAELQKVRAEWAALEERIMAQQAGEGRL